MLARLILYLKTCDGNTMRALSHLAKFDGLHEEWQKIVRQNELRWKQAEDDFSFFEKENIDEMLGYVKGVSRSHPGECANTFIFATLTCLRAEEACQSIKLINHNAKEYYNSPYHILEHFRFKDIFIWCSKKSFISLVDDEILDIARQPCDSRMAISSRLKRRDTHMRMSYCRKVFGTWLRKNGIETELIDML